LTGQTAAELEVLNPLRAAILRGDYAPLQRLIEGDLCEQYNASRFTVRAALQALAAEGLVEMQRNRGARVRQVSIDEAIEISEVRRAVEGLIAGRAAERASAEDGAELREIVAEMRVAAESGWMLQYSDLNARLHQTVRRIAQHETASQIIEQLHGQLVRHQFQLSLVPGRPAVSLGQHEAIAFAIAANDGPAAERAMREHISSVIEALKDLPARP
jgi:DNA-binding GntR family transcriptional regulator